MVSVAERRQADRFFADLLGGPRGSTRPHPFAHPSHESLDEQDPNAPLFTLGASVGAGKATNAAADVTALKERLKALGFDWVTAGTAIDADTKQAIRLFQSIIRGKEKIVGDGRVDVPGTTYRWLQAVNAPRWQLMPAGSQAEGFFNHELVDTSDDRDHGTDWMAQTIRRAGARYREDYLRAHPNAALLPINDVSRPRGGKAKPHAGHQTGLACDVRVPRTDGTSGKTTWKDLMFDRDAARAMIKALRAQPLVTTIYFNDKTLRSEGLCTKADGHDNHIHFQIKPPQLGEIDTLFTRLGSASSGGSFLW